jgi:hypothetical protein
MHGKGAGARAIGERNDCYSIEADGRRTIEVRVPLESQHNGHRSF